MEGIHLAQQRLPQTDIYHSVFPYSSSPRLNAFSITPSFNLYPFAANSFERRKGFVS